MRSEVIQMRGRHNIICSKHGDVGLHIATLIVIDCEDAKLAPTTRSYPIVRSGINPDGEVWTHSEVGDCMVICPARSDITLSTFGKVLAWVKNNFGSGYNLLLYFTPQKAKVNLALFGCKILLARTNDGSEKTDYEVKLRFKDDYEIRGTKIISSRDSHFYFASGYSWSDEYDTDIDDDGNEVRVKSCWDKTEAMTDLAMQRDFQLTALRSVGVNSITFATDDEQYKEFVDQLNKIPDSIKGDRELDFWVDHLDGTEQLNDTRISEYANDKLRIYTTAIITHMLEERLGKPDQHYTDKQVADAIILTFGVKGDKKKFHQYDWVGIYRILVDNPKWFDEPFPSKFEEFPTRIGKLDFGGVEPSCPCSAQSIQKELGDLGVANDANFDVWREKLNNGKANKRLIKQIGNANVFMQNLEIVAKKAEQEKE